MDCQLSLRSASRGRRGEEGTPPSESSSLLAEVRVPRGSQLLGAILRAGLPIAAACRGDGLCGRCGVYVRGVKLAAESGAESLAKRRNRVAAAKRLACCLRVQSDLEVSSDYW